MASTLTAAAAVSLHGRVAAMGIQPGSCMLMPEQEVGPYYVADELVRSQIAEGHPGIPLNLLLTLQDSRTCRPLANAAVDLWHCDAGGVYSGFVEQSRMGDRGGFGGRGPEPPDGRSGPPREGRGGPPPGGRGDMGPPPGRGPTDTEKFCRGIQITGTDGVAAFTTVFPGFYMGRTNHIHFKVRLGGETRERTYKEGHTSHIGQIFFPEELCARLMELEPYKSHAIHRTTQAEDGIFQDEHGVESMARLEPMRGTDFTGGIRAYLVAGVDPGATPAPVGRGGGPGRGRGR